MKKFIIPHPEKKGALKLVSAHNCPPDAICEAPDSFTREMEPFMKLSPIKKPDGSESFSVEVEQRFNQMKEEEKQALIEVEKQKHSQIVKAAERVQQIQAFNELNPAERFAKNVLGDLWKVAKPSIFALIVQQILGALKKGGEK